MTVTTTPTTETYPLEPGPDPGPETTPGPRITSEVYVMPETQVELYDYGSGCHIRIGDFYESSAVLALGYNERTRRDACDRLIAVLTAAREWTPAPTESELRLIDGNR